MVMHALQAFTSAAALFLGASLLAAAKAREPQTSSEPVTGGSRAASFHLAADQLFDRTDSPPRRLIYRPPPGAKPGVRINAASRGPGDITPSLYVLAPDHIAHTASEQPNLYCWVSTQTTNTIEFTLV